MPRYELSEGGITGAHKFWEITLTGPAYVVRWGRIGTRGVTTTKRFETDSAAAAAFGKAIREKTNKGYKLVEGTGPERPPLPASPSAPEARNADLEAAIEADPDDEQAYLVYGDWLQGQGDPRGELIALQAAMKRESDPGRFLGLRRRETELLETHKPALYGPILEHLGTLEVTWRYGWIHAGALLRPWQPNQPGPTSGTVLKALLGAPSARFLQELTIPSPYSPADGGFEGLLPLLLDVPRPRTLRVLHLAHPKYQSETECYDVRVGDATGLVSAFPQLERLGINGREPFLARWDFPRMRRLDLRSSDLDLPVLGPMMEASWPSLEWLTLGFCGATGVVASDLAPLLAGERVPALRHLAIHAVPFGDELVRLLARSPLLRRLTHLDLGSSMLSAEGARALAEEAAAFRHLKKMVVDVAEVPSDLYDPVLRGLKGVGAGIQVRFHGQVPRARAQAAAVPARGARARGEDDGRYDEIEE